MDIEKDQYQHKMHKTVTILPTITEQFQYLGLSIQWTSDSTRQTHPRHSVYGIS
jgi:hypothetical protein